MPNTISAKNSVALLGSIIFFAWGEPVFVGLLLIGTYVDYQVSLYLDPTFPLKKRLKKYILAAAISLNVLILIASKYLSFICTEILPVLGHWIRPFAHPSDLPLILGISFITFHKISYLVDSYHGRASPPKHFYDCALYIFFFPQLIAGPIIRYHDIGDQIQERNHSSHIFLNGFFRFSIGMIKKLLIADVLGMTADKVFHLSHQELTPLFAWGGAVAYSLQIYFDFSAYSDMAIGLARMMGFNFPENFNRPYRAKSITEFWQRWHISLSRWMRLYLYIPLGGNRGTSIRTYTNLWIVFLISGFWHGASWTFIAWGAYYGFFLSLERLSPSIPVINRIVLPETFRRFLTLLIVIIGWVFFRSETLSDAIYYLKVMAGFDALAVTHTTPWGVIFNNHAVFTIIVASLLATMVVPKIPQAKFNQLQDFWSTGTFTIGQGMLNIQFLVTLFFILLSAGAILSSGYSPFLYFRF